MMDRHNPPRMGASQRYGPTPFRHNIRIGIILMPTLVTLIGFGGKLSAAIIMIGAMVRPFCTSCVLQCSLQRMGVLEQSDDGPLHKGMMCFLGRRLPT